MKNLSVKELHRTTGEYVRQAGASRTPLIVTDRGEPVAVLANPALLKPKKRVRTLLPEFEKLMAKPPGNDLREDLDAVRGDR